MHRHALPLLLVAALLVSGCGSDEPPLVTFGVAGQERSTGPTQYCDLQLRDCKGDAGAEVTLPVPVGTNVRIHVPDEVSQAPWHVVFSYRSSAGQQVDDRSPVFAPTRQQDYTLVLPAATDQLVTAQVQQFGPAPAMNPQTGEIEFPVRGTWVLQAQGS